MGAGARLFGGTWTDTEHMRLLNPVLLIGERCIQRADSKGMRPGALVDIRLECEVKRAQCLVVKVVEEIPEQTQVKTRTFGEIERLVEVLNQFCFAQFIPLHLQHGVGKHGSEMQPAPVLRKKPDGFRQCRTNLQDRQASVRVDFFYQQRK